MRGNKAFSKEEIERLRNTKEAKEEAHEVVIIA